jgi:hypothetical protein
MHAQHILQKSFADVFSRMHRARVTVLMQAVLALLSCRRLVMMDLARAWAGYERVRTPLKKIDRLLSNQHLHRERSMLYGQLAQYLACTREALVVVDWSTLKRDESWYLLRAAVAMKGRALTLYEEVHPQPRYQSPRVQRTFLRRLKALIPSGCQVTIITDAGFRSPWFEQVQALGWHWVGRVRACVCVRLHSAGPWQYLQDLLQSSRKLTRFGAVQLVRKKPFDCQLLRYRAPPRGRKHRTRKGRIRQDKNSREAARSQSEPWLLAYSNSLAARPPLQIINHYRQRMQIEQSFRDLKSDRFGSAFCHSLTRKGARLEMLLLLQALASFLAWLQGAAKAVLNDTLHCVIRASSRAHYSILRIGWESLRRLQPSPPLLIHALRSVPSFILLLQD